jgi:DNA-binding CsgD family transcriptional regulator
MATRGNLKEVEFKQAAVSATSASVGAPSAAVALPAPSPAAGLRSADAIRPSGERSQSPASAVAAVAAVAAKSASATPRFTTEETILLRGLASGASSKEMAAQMRLPRESLYRLIGDLRRKTGTTSDTALAVWVLRNMSATDRRGGSR